VRLAKFNLEIQEDKTKIIKFGRFAVDECKKAGIKKPETFDFLGFTHYCSKGKTDVSELRGKPARRSITLA
jgi:hypothetical protein